MQTELCEQQMLCTCCDPEGGVGSLQSHQCGETHLDTCKWCMLCLCRHIIYLCGRFSTGTSSQVHCYCVHCLAVTAGRSVVACQHGKLLRLQCSAMAWQTPVACCSSSCQYTRCPYAGILVCCGIAQPYCMHCCQELTVLAWSSLLLPECAACVSHTGTNSQTVWPCAGPVLP